MQAGLPSHAAGAISLPSAAVSFQLGACRCFVLLRLTAACCLPRPSGTERNLSPIRVPPSISSSIAADSRMRPEQSTEAQIYSVHRDVPKFPTYE